MSKLADPSAAHVVINAFAPSRAAKDFLTKLVQTYDYPLCETLVRYSTVVDAATIAKTVGKESKISLGDSRYDGSNRGGMRIWHR